MNKDMLIKRLKSFAWRAAGMLITAFLGFVVANLPLTGLSATIVGVIGLAVGELTKVLNTYFTAKSADADMSV